MGGANRLGQHGPVNGRRLDYFSILHALKGQIALADGALAKTISLDESRR
jgi:hypothetical protein